MGRPRSFDESKVLDAALERFWRFGFAATSLRNLETATGLGSTSLYNAFGDKHALFTRCLDRYLDRGMRERIARLEATLPPRAAIEAFIDDVVIRSMEGRRGCLLVNTALELGPHDQAVARTVAARLVELERFFHRCIVAGQAAGTIGPGCHARDVSRLLVTTVMGLRVLARARPQPALLRGAAREALAVLDRSRRSAGAD